MAPIWVNIAIKTLAAPTAHQRKLSKWLMILIVVSSAT